MQMNLTETRYANIPPGVHMMGELLIPDERVLLALYNSGLTEDLRDFEISLLTGLISVQYFEARGYTEDMYDHLLKESLMVLVEGNIEVNAMINNEPVLLNLETPGDVARIISFVGGKTVSAKMKVRKDSAVLLLQRAKLETLLHSHPSIVYIVMRNLVRHVHGVARRNNAEMKEMTNYIFRINGRY